MTTFNPFHRGSGNGQTPFSSTNPNQSPVQSRVIRTRKPINRPPELPSNHPIVKPELSKVEYKDDKRNEKKKGKEKNEPLLHPLAAVLTPIGMFVSQDVIFEKGKYTKLANRKMKQKVKEVCDSACRKAKKFQNHIFPQSVTKDYGQLQRQNIHNGRDKKQLNVLVTRKGPIHERPNDFEATSSEGWKETKILYSHLLESPPPKYKDSPPRSPPHSLEFAKELEPNNKFEWMNQNDIEKENPVKFLFHIEGPGNESNVRAMNSRRTGKKKVP